MQMNNTFPPLQYPGLFSICFFMALFIYTQPYKSTAANIAEFILSIGTILLLLQSISGARFQFRTVVADTNSTCSDENSVFTLNVWLWSTCYYIPVIVTTVLIILSLVKFLRSGHWSINGNLWML